MQGNLAQLVAQVRSGADGILTASREVAAGNLDLSQRTEEQASSLEETAASMMELTSTVRQNVDNAQQANQMAEAASRIATEGEAVVGQVVDTMESINASSNKIVDIISVIDEEIKALIDDSVEKVGAGGKRWQRRARPWRRSSPASSG